MSAEVVPVPLPHLKDWLTETPTFPNPLSEKRNQQYRNAGEYILETIIGHAETSLQSREKIKKDYNAIYRAGPRREVYFGTDTNACIVNTGGLCPGLNSVIEELVRTLDTYNADTIYGIRYGFLGFDTTEYMPLILTPHSVLNIHQRGGTILGTCRGSFNEDLILKFLKECNIGQMYVIGGDGSHRAALRIHALCKEHQLRCVVVGIPKTIDNDILFFDKTFGFDTAVEVASKVIDCSFVEASSVKNGVGVVKVMGRDSGFVARNAALSNNVVDACLIPEVPFEIKGNGGLLPWLDGHLATKHCAVIVICEAAGQQHLPCLGKDPTGHNIYEDTGKWLKKAIETHWQETGQEGKVFLIDPSYMLRSVPANTGDNMFCIQLAQAAVHTAYSGYSGVTVGRYHDLYGVMPIEMVVSGLRKVNPKGSLWQTLKTRLAFYPGEKALVERHAEEDSSPLWKKLKAENGDSEQSSQTLRSVSEVTSPL
eukprot:GGOE01018102.1.p1 GENE.GGOE01018102.1~~GGOE01018102.1.p1  ORF type:complete len:494 (+),score=144.75 GGOE01018102.1:38-1483(+)